MSRMIVVLLMVLAMGWFAVGCEEAGPSGPTGDTSKGLETAADLEKAGKEEKAPDAGPPSEKKAKEAEGSAEK